VSGAKASEHQGVIVGRLEREFRRVGYPKPEEKQSNADPGGSGKVAMIQGSGGSASNGEAPVR
jgi:hypothetical protein